VSGPQVQATVTDSSLGDMEAVIQKGLAATGLTIGHLLLFAQLQRAGAEVRPPLFAGGHTSIKLLSGETVSLSELLRRARVGKILSAVCQRCGEVILPTAYTRRERSARLGRRYCSNACRQAAHRARSTGGRPPEVVTSLGPGRSPFVQLLTDSPGLALAGGLES
jgi:hypothetical protein